ncbi:hypothetical protein [Mucilaginibacter sp.]|jgi:hypothetical protein|uniref:hypothetical protein n=1 Tax=Mucilaginibacter sp. TaxID=1882438 RepID=UPI002BD99200|nr:hypothetical protein [Mucilaginibacter sp.]HTI59431.1 hypothetical protein [Mucilaginibacter sp.]
MKKPYLVIIPALFVFYSCHQNEIKLIDGPKFSVNKGKKDNADFSAGGTGTGDGNGTAGAGAVALNGFNLNSNEAMSKKDIPQTIVEELPRSYKQRKFMNDVSSISYDLFMIPGNIVTFNPTDTTYQMRTLRAITKNSKPPVVTSINDGVLYSAKVNSTTSFNGSYLIGGLNVNRDEIMELNIQDVAISTVPDSLIDVDAIKSAIADIPAEEKKNLYYIKSATLTLIENRKYTESKFDASINSFFVTSGGKTYSSNEKLKRDRTVSIYIVPLDHIISAR